jgi:hypothetical protein
MDCLNGKKSDQVLEEEVVWLELEPEQATEPGFGEEKPGNVCKDTIPEKWEKEECIQCQI